MNLFLSLINSLFHFIPIFFLFFSRRRSNGIVRDEATPNEPVVSVVKSQASSPPLKSSIASKSSQIWRHFTIDKTNKLLAKCNYCEKSYKHSGNTTNLTTHLKAKHPDILSVSNGKTKLSNTKFKVS